jgi:hypothetical protein
MPGPGRWRAVRPELRDETVQVRTVNVVDELVETHPAHDVEAYGARAPPPPPPPPPRSGGHHHHLDSQSRYLPHLR